MATDVVIDSCGAFVGLLIVFLVERLRQKAASRRYSGTNIE